ncbi:MAG: sensor histidine kinase [Candidatus Thiodiazotropha sp.]
MTLVKDKYGLVAVGQSQLALSVSPITPKKPSASSEKSLKDAISLIESRLVPAFLESVDYTDAAANRIGVEEEEKKRISRELHDGLGQLLTSMNLHIQTCIDGNDELSEDSVQEQQKESLQALSCLVKQAMSEVRTICSAIRPAILDDLGVLAAISWQCRQISQLNEKLVVETDFKIDETAIPEELKSVIYRIAQESLNNAMKYSQASEVKLSLLHTHDSIELTIVDNGIGFDCNRINERLGVGLMSMRDRANSVNGALKVKSAVGYGVEIHVSFPLKKIALNG